MSTPLSSLRLKKLPRSFYLQPTLTVAKSLVGMYMCRRLGRQLLVGRIVEVEAYLGEKDPASHAYRGRTRRNDVMFREGGHLYVYFTYGMHFCSNVVTEQEGIARAVLLRGVEPLHGIESMRKNRSGVPTASLTNGPAKLCHAFGITTAQNGTDLCAKEIWLAKSAIPVKSVRLARSRRVGISDGVKHKWRFYVKDHPFVSPGKPVKG